VVLDNLKEGVLLPDIYDPLLNPLFRDVLAHYGVVALPCRIKDPDRKGKVESGVGHTKKTPLKGMRFESLEAGVSGALGRTLGRYTHTRYDETTGCGHSSSSPVFEGSENPTRIASASR
jgi:transposase